MGKTRITKTVTSIPSARASKFMKTMGMSRSKRFKRRMGGSKRVFGQRGPEIKYIDTIIDDVGSSGGNVTCLNLVATGTDNTNRIGRKIDIKSVEVKGTYNYTIDTVAAANLITRWAIVLDKQPNGALATFDQIYNTAGGASPWSMRNLDYIERFDVLAQDLFCLNPQYNAATAGDTSNGQANSYYMVDKFVKTNIGSRYDGTASNIASLETGALLFIDLTDSNTGGTNASQAFYATCRVRFLDE